MKTSKEFFERLLNDEAFAKEVEAKAKAKIEAGEQDYVKIWTPIGEEYGYKLTSEELEERYNAGLSELSEEELGKVAGGTTPLVAFVTSLIISGIGSARASVDIAENGWD